MASGSSQIKILSSEILPFIKSCQSNPTFLKPSASTAKFIIRPSFFCTINSPWSKIILPSNIFSSTGRILIAISGGSFKVQLVAVLIIICKSLIKGHFILVCHSWQSIGMSQHVFTRNESCVKNNILLKMNMIRAPF